MNDAETEVKMDNNMMRLCIGSVFIRQTKPTNAQGNPLPSALLELALFQVETEVFPEHKRKTVAGRVFLGGDSIAKGKRDRAELL